MPNANERKANEMEEETDSAAVEDIVRRGPSGALAVAGVATLLVVAIYFAFYFFAYLPRGAVH